MTPQPHRRRAGSRYEPRPGDIILYPVSPCSEWASKFVAVGELILRMGRYKELYSHCALVDVETDHQLEAYWPRTRCSPIPKGRPYEVWRIEGETKKQAEASVRWAYANLNEVYNMAGLLLGWMRIRFHERYCSQFVRASKKAEGFHMPHDERGYFSPNQLADWVRRHGFKVTEVL